MGSFVVDPNDPGHDHILDSDPEVDTSDSDLTGRLAVGTVL